jgi:hypothetical protein
MLSFFACDYLLKLVPMVLTCYGFFQLLYVRSGAFSCGDILLCFLLFKFILIAECLEAPI